VYVPQESDARFSGVSADARNGARSPACTASARSEGSAESSLATEMPFLHAARVRVLHCDVRARMLARSLARRSLAGGRVELSFKQIIDKRKVTLVCFLISVALLERRLSIAPIVPYTRE